MLIDTKLRGISLRVLQVCWKMESFLSLLLLIASIVNLILGMEPFCRLAKSSVKLSSRNVKFMHLASHVQCALEPSISQELRSYFIASLIVILITAPCWWLLKFPDNFIFYTPFETEIGLWGQSWSCHCNWVRWFHCRCIKRHWILSKG